jgi:hypothetical protein
VERHAVEEMVVVARDEDRRTARRHMMKAGYLGFEAPPGEAMSDQAHHAMHDDVINCFDGHRPWAKLQSRDWRAVV